MSDIETLSKNRTADALIVMSEFLNGKKIQCRQIPGISTPHGWSSEWEDTGCPLWNFATFDYRVKPAEKPSINWDHVSDKYNWLAVDQCGGFLFTTKPIYDDDNRYWFPSEPGSMTPAGAFASLNIGNCSYEESLVQRPTTQEK